MGLACPDSTMVPGSRDFPGLATMSPPWGWRNLPDRWSPGLATRAILMSPRWGWRFPHTRRSRVSRPGLYEVGPPGLRQTMNHPQSFSLPLARTRRHFFRDCGVGVGKIALALAAGRGQGGRPTRPTSGRRGRQPARAQAAALRPEGQARHLPVHGRRARASSTCSTTSRSWRKFDGKLPPRRAAQGLPALAFIKPDAEAARPASSSSPGTASAAPSCPSCCRTWPRSSTTSAIVKSMHTDAFNHAPAQIFMNTGSPQFGRPSMGSWVTYGLGSESQDLPGFVVLSVRRDGPQRRRRELGERLPADGLPGRAVPHRAATRSSTSSNPPGVDRRAPARLARR